MKNLLTLLFLFIGLQTFSQSKAFDKVWVFAGLPNGFGAEIGKDIKDKKIGYNFGFSVDLGKAVDEGGSDIMFYTKGVYSVHKNIGVVGMVGVEDLKRVPLGVGLRGTIPVDGVDIIVEPLWRTNGSRLNFGVLLHL